MKVRDSGMPEEEVWSTFFDPISILHQMEVTPDLESVIDLGCGFGTFTIPASTIVKGRILAFDIDQAMIDELKNKIDQHKITTIDLYQHDFIANGSGLANDSIDYVMLFNILHHDIPNQILREVNRILRPGGKAGIIHWRSDVPTPRGPNLEIRPTPNDCKKWADESGFSVMKEMLLEPFHFGILIQKPIIK